MIIFKVSDFYLMRFIFEKSAWTPDWSLLINPGREGPESGGGDFFVAGPEHKSKI
jgi:hypothetical protein